MFTTLNVKAVDKEKEKKSETTETQEPAKPPGPVVDEAKYASELCAKYYNGVSIADVYNIRAKYVLDPENPEKTPELKITMGYKEDGTLDEKTDMVFSIAEIVVARNPALKEEELSAELKGVITYNKYKGNPSYLVIDGRQPLVYTNYASFNKCGTQASYDRYCGTDYQRRSLFNRYGISNDNNSDLGYKGTISLSAGESFPSRYYIVFESKENDPTLLQKCGINTKSNPIIMIDIPAYKAQPTIEVQPAPPAQVITTGLIDCKINHPDGSFEKLFCDDKGAAENQGVKWRKFSAKNPNYASYIENGGEAVSAFTCDTGLFNTTGKFEYNNKSYLLGKIENQKIEVGYYTYKLGGQYLSKEPGVYTSLSFNDIDKDLENQYDKVKAVNVKTEAISCEIACNEVVTIEYGSPVASKAGLCFEYRVKVTSRVNCSAKQPNEPTIYKRIHPVPVCRHCGQDDRYPGAGPNQVFDSCINSCDGGKYTQKCSEKCYKKVYQTNSFTKTNYLEKFGDLLATKMVNGYNKRKPTIDDYYYMNGNSVVWYNSEETIGQWYYDYNVSEFISGRHGCSYNGAAALCSCCASCWWENGSRNKYLNNGEQQRDYIMNIKERDAAVIKCSQYSKCSTTQAEFTISASYIHNGEDVTINYPYSSKNGQSTPDTIQYKDGSVLCETKKNVNTTLFTPITTENHCYNCGASFEDGNSSSQLYIAEWGFPGIWVNGKSKTVSYTPKNGWLKVEGKFCIPENAEDVNQRWYNLYYTTNINKNKAVYSYNSTSSEKNGSCEIDFSSCETEVPKSDIKYNINANTKNFGMFGWDINVKCFYALNTCFPYYGENTSCNTNCKKCPSGEKELDYVIRSVDLGDLFPSSDGTPTAASESGRAPGFNWTEFANNDKIEKYISNPKEYMEWVQDKGNDIYDGKEYLDYDIILSRQDIKTLRDRKKNMKGFNETDNVNETSDKIIDYDYITSYKSELLRGGNPILKNIDVPKDNVLKCNNIKNFESNSCYNGED